MLKSKSLEDLNRGCHEELFTELTPKEGAAIGGGNIYTFDNRCNRNFNPQVNGVQYRVPPLSQLSVYSPSSQAVIAYDNQIGPGYRLASAVTCPGVTGVDCNNSNFIVVPPQCGGGPSAVGPQPAIGGGPQPAIGGGPQPAIAFGPQPTSLNV